MLLAPGRIPCPECGRDLSLPNSLRLGQRHRRPTLAVLGFLLLLLGLLPLAGLATVIARQIDWYQYRPASWLVQDLTSPNFAQYNRAWNELDRRHKSSAGLSPSVEQKLIALALKQQAQPTSVPLQGELVDFLGDMFLANKLTKSQSDLFFAQAIVLQLAVRPTVIAGDDVPYMLALTGRTPSNNWWFRISFIQAKIGDRVVRDGGSTTFSGSASGNFGSYGKVTTPGKHTVETTNRIDFFNGPSDDERASRLCCTRTLTFKADFQALEKAPADYIKLIDDPTLQPKIQKAITVPQCVKYADRYNLVIDIKNAPANVAFDVFARLGTLEYPLGYIALPKGRQCSFRLNAGSLNGVFPRKIDLVFRSSEKVARRTTNLFEIWSGEILLKDVEVHLPLP
jgi:hypothetical protein